MINPQIAKLSFLAQEATRKNIFWWLIFLCIICGFLHVAIGSDSLIPLLAITAIMMGVVPVANFGVVNIGAVLVFLVAFRYVGVSLFAKLFFGQALDTNLENPLCAFLAVAVGVAAYFIGFISVNRMNVGLPLLRSITHHGLLRRISYYSFLIGFVSNLECALRVSSSIPVWNISSAFMPFLHLSLISAAASSITRSDERRIFDVWVVVVLAVEIIFSFIQNSRAMIVEVFLALILTDIAFRGKITKKQITSAIIAILLLIIITPVFLVVRNFREDLGWKERIFFTMQVFTRLDEANDSYSKYLYMLDAEALTGKFYLNYYEMPNNLLERVSLVNNTDLFMDGANSIGYVKFEVIGRAIKFALPRFFVPDKPVDYSEGDWLHYYYTGEYRYGNFLSSPLVGVGYVSFGWVGVFVFPLFISIIMFLIIKKATGLDIQNNVWAIFILASINNTFVEGGFQGNMAVILRVLPQEIIVMMIISIFIGINKVHIFK
ncbi:MAG: hypothetical protein FWF95_03475 [Syntrophorhabdaceae bacterium]|nr:hypothetical protein [Syntrophorhabdaceae bacterium]